MLQAHYFPCLLPPPMVRHQNIFYCIKRNRFVLIHCFRDNRRDVGETYSPGQKSFDGNLVGGIQHRRHALPAVKRLVCEFQRRETWHDPG